jgi:hypothetical protein
VEGKINKIELNMRINLKGFWKRKERRIDNCYSESEVWLERGLSLVGPGERIKVGAQVSRMAAATPAKTAGGWVKKSDLSNMAMSCHPMSHPRVAEPT